ncbi:hypothetical protein LQW54_010293 [Pestalotiopsis sp. IQ-011]
MPASPLSLGQTTIPSNVLDDIQKWISDQRALEKSSGGPVQVPVTIYDAAMALHACFAVQTDAPAGDETNWIGLLTRYKQAKFPHAKNDPVTFSDHQAEDSLPHEPKWHSFVTIEGVAGKFPDQAVDGPSPPPSFLRKKDARQHASKCAVTWLMQERLMPSNGVDVKFKNLKKVSFATPDAQQPAAKKQRRDAAPPPAGGAAVPVSSPSGTTSASSTTQSANSAAAKSKAAQAPAQSPFGDGGECAVQKVAELCTKLKLHPPSYKIASENGRSDTFQGHAEVDHGFLASVGELPSRWSHVDGVVGGKAWAKEQIAEKVLIVLQDLEAKRNIRLASLEKMMMGLAPAKA